MSDCAEGEILDKCLCVTVHTCVGVGAHFLLSVISPFDSNMLGSVNVHS